jgi:formate dehydrogenase subunit gamma
LTGQQNCIGCGYCVSGCPFDIPKFNPATKNPWFDVAFTVSMVVMYMHWGRDMRITDADRRWSQAMEYYIKNEDEKLAPEGRFNYGQKLFFWLMFFGVILLLISGFGLWFVESIPWWLRYPSIVIHVASAFATIGGFIIHVYMGTATVRGGFTSTTFRV